ncbi:MAG: HAMP domain-containing protein, partial [Prochloraceae cyanobacterium]|nr:HAMP domain-containing protein [Prochloraceae cyanobacterium]
MKIFQKLSLAFLSSAFLLGGVGVISLRGNTQAKINIDQAILKGNKTTILLANIHSDLRKLESETYNYFWQKKTGISDEYLEQDKQKILEIIPGLSKKILDLDRASEELLRFDMNSPIELEEEENEEGEELKDELDLIRIADKLQEKNLKLEKIIKEILEPNNIDRDRELISNQLETLFNDEIYPLLERYQANFYDDQEEKTEVITTYLNNNDIIIGSSTGIALILSFILGIYTIYTISRPLEQLKGAALDVGTGKLNVQVPVFGKDEIGILAQTFNQMVSGLKDTTVSKSYLDKILSSMVDSLIVLSADGTIKKVNPATYQLLEYLETELIEQNFQLIVSDSALEIDDLIQKGALKNFDLTYLTKQGKQIPIAFS